MTENWEHFRRAALVLVGPGPVKQRLCDAYLRHLSEVESSALPRDLQPGYEALTAAMQSARPTGGLGAVEVTVRKMSEQEAGDHAARVLEMLIAMSGADAIEPSAPPSRQLRLVADDDEIPAFLNRA
jgi:hypothetical protein